MRAQANFSKVQCQWQLMMHLVARVVLLYRLLKMPIDVLCIGTGEYTTGYGLNSAKTDKSAGVVMLALFDLRARGLVRAIHLAGTTGAKFPAIRAHMAAKIGAAYPGSAFDLSCCTYPADAAAPDPLAYRAALAALPRGSAVLIFTPDDTHFALAQDALAAGMHVLLTKPLVLTLAEHCALRDAAAAGGVLCCGEFHKRWDPMYADARERLRRLGDLSFFTAFMSQPKIQLDTFAAWAGKSSDISFYLNSHHIDVCEWVMAGRGRPLTVTAAAATGVAEARLGRPCEDTISLTVVWENLPSRARGVATYVASWVASPGDVHSQQRFFAMMRDGEVTCDQAHRGFSTATEAAGYASPNPLYMRYTPDARGRFAGQLGYGYRSIEDFVRAAEECAAGRAGPGDYEAVLATAAGTLQGTAILEAGRRSLDAGGRAVRILYAGGEGGDSQEPTGLE